MFTKTLEFHPVTASRWRDLETLFGERGACGGCWCMYWRLTSAQFKELKGAGNRQAMQQLIQSGVEPGLLAYAAGQPVAWCAVAPREHYVRLASSRILQPVDDQAVWAISCFFIAKSHRRQGLSVKLLQADAFVWTGLASAFRKAGFEEVARRSDTRPIMRFTIQ
jgi:GNAT superfamily N-acetyltransferase